MSFLALFHTPATTDYAVTAYKEVFASVGEKITGDRSNVTLCFTELDARGAPHIPAGVGNLAEFPWIERSVSDSALRDFSQVLRSRRVTTLVGVDLPVGHPVHGVARDSGVRRVVAYWGAPMSSLNRGLWLLLKKTAFALRKDVADRYIFESEAMRETAARGRGIPSARTAVVPLGVDTSRYHPAAAGAETDLGPLGVPADRLAVVYSGHMARRKGVWVLMEAARHLVDELGDRRFHFLICGNRGAEAEPLQVMIEGTGAAEHVTFAGYRNDLPSLLRACDIGVIASTGWESFTMSSVEMLASGLPLLVSDLQGLSETTEHGVTGFVVPPADPRALAARLQELADDSQLRHRFSQAARARAVARFGREAQIERLVAEIQGET